MPLWTARLRFDGVIDTPTPTGPDPMVDHPGFTTGVGLVVGDGLGNQWVAQCGTTLIDDGMGNLIGGEYCALISRQTKPPFFVDTADPFTWGAGTAPSVSSAGTAAYLAGGTLSVTKDFGSNLITVTAPTGTTSMALDADDGQRAVSALNNERLLPQGFGFFYIFDNVHSPPQDSEAQARFYDFGGLKDGIVFFNIAMSTSDPGDWFVVNEYPFDVTLNGEEVTAFGPFIPSGPISASQDLTRYTLNASIPGVDQTVPAIETHENFWKYYAHVPPLSDDTDMEIAREHGVVWRGGPDIHDGTVMLVQRTFDNAHSWETWTAFSDPLTMNSSPTVTWYNGRLYLTWYDGSAIRQARSLTGGRQWDVPTTIPFTGTNPRRVIDRTGGGAFLFYFDGSDLKVVITYDSGASYTGPIIVAAAVGAQQIDAEFVPDGSLVVSLFVAGVWSQYRSRDLGLTWV